MYKEHTLSFISVMFNKESNKHVPILFSVELLVFDKRGSKKYIPMIMILVHLCSIMALNGWWQKNKSDYYNVT